MPREPGDDADGQSVLAVGAGDEVLNEDLFVAEEGEQVVVDSVELRFGERLIDTAPVDRVFRNFVADDVFVFWRAAGELSRSDDEGAAAGKHAFVAKDSAFDQLSG